MEQKIIIYTDGSSIGNPGPGGYGIVMKFGKHRKELSKGFRKTTNNRMELLAVIEALRALKRTDLDIELYSDSKYVIDAIEKGWMYDWKRKGFKKKKNPDLWLELMEIYAKYNVKLHWVKGHDGIEENERCDKLAKQAADNPLEIDYGYEKATENLFD